MIGEDLAAAIATHAHGRVPRELRRRQVLAEGYDLFVERGYHGASMDELARRVGVSKPVIYDLVGSKERLFRDVMAEIQEELVARLAAAVLGEPDLASKLRAGILAFLRFVDERRRGWAALLAFESGGSEITTMRRGGAALVAGLIAGSVGVEGEGLEALAHGVNGAVESVALWWQDHPELTAEALADLLVALLLPGLLALSRGPDGADR